ncbi:hypothetical protein M0805_001523 [Coniferiporia weirii]|nr:hypothetical protein M0805_001523 [Coniferiporia weirii]
METVPFEIQENDELVIEEMGPDGVPLGYMNPVLQLESDESSDEEDADNNGQLEGDAPEVQDDEDMPEVFVGATPTSQAASKSKFLLALMRASQLYSSRLRVPSAPSSFSALPVLQSTLPTIGQPLLSDMVESDVEDDGVFSSEDEYSDDELLGDRPTLDADQAAQLFYHPTGPWAKFANVPIENSVVISKLNAGAMCEAYIKQGTIQGREITYISKTWLLCQEWEGFFSEMALYSHPSYLQPLQGSVIPAIIGVYLVDGAISVAMELPSSSFWIEASDDMSDHLKRKCIAAFDMIHDCGVLHNDVELRHMLISAEGDVTIIDFQGSQALKSIEEVGLEAASEADIRLEKRKVMFKLNYGNARINENEKRKRVFEREKRNIRRRRRRVQAAAQAGGGGSITPLGDDESDAEDPDDVLNPIVESHIWFDCWVGEDFEPVCYIVPGQVDSEVRKALQEFAFKEFERQQKGKATEFKGSVLAEPRSTSLSGAAGRPHLSHSSGSPKLPLRTFEDEGALGRTIGHAFPSLKMGSQLAPILPTRVNFKRGRGYSENSFDDDALQDSPPWKKYHVTPTSGSSGLISNTSSFLAADPSETSSPVSILSASTSTEVLFPPIIPPLNLSHAANALLEKVPADIQVPYDGYSGAGGFTIPNTFSPKEIAGMRRVWIMRDNVQHCKEEGLPYPLAQRFGLTPSTERQTYDYGRNGKKKKKRLTTNRGALKRAQMEREEPGRRKRDAMARKAEYFKKREREFDTSLGDSYPGNYNSLEEGDGGTIEGPEILTWVDFFDYETSQRTDARTTSPPRNSQGTTTSNGTSSTRRRGILRRQLSPSEKARQRAYNEWVKKHRPHDSDDDEGDERASKHSRIATSSFSESPVSTPIAASGFQRYTSTPNAFNIRSASTFGTASEPRSSPSVPNASTAAVPSSLHSILRPCTSPFIMSSFSAHASVAKRRRSLDVSDSDSSEENDCVRPPKVHIPKKNSRSTRPMRLADANFDPRRSFGAWVPSSERHPGFHPAPVSEDDQSEMAVVENMIEVDAGGAGRLLSIVSSIFKRSWT